MEALDGSGSSNQFTSSSSDPLVNAAKMVSLSVQFETVVFNDSAAIIPPNLPEVLDRVKKVDLVFLELHGMQAAIFEKIARNLVNPQDFEKCWDQLGIVKNRAVAQKTPLKTLFEEVPRLRNPEKKPAKDHNIFHLLPELVRTIQKLSNRSFLILKRNERLRRLVSSNQLIFQSPQVRSSICRWLAEVTDFKSERWRHYREITNSNDFRIKVSSLEQVFTPISQQIDAQTQNSTSISKSQLRAIYSWQLQGCHFAGQVATVFKQQVKAANLELQYESVVNSELAVVEKQIEDCTQKVLTQIAAKASKEFAGFTGKDEISNLDLTSKKYFSIHSSSLWEAFWNFFGSYPQSAKVSKVFKPIGEAIFGLEEKVETCLELLVDDPEKAKELFDNLDLKLFYTLHKRLIAAYTFLNQCELDRLMSIGKVGDLLQAILDDTRKKRKVIQSVINDKHLWELIVLQADFLRFLEKEQSTDGIDSEERIKEFYKLVNRLYLLRKELKENPQVTQNDFLVQSTANTSCLLTDAFTMIGPAALNLTKLERVGFGLLGQKDLTHLYGPDESREGLPVLIKLLLVTKVTHLRHFVNIYEDKLYNISLEQWLRVLETNKDYKKLLVWTFDNDPEFKNIIEALMDPEIKRLSDLTSEQLDTGNEIYRLMDQAEQLKPRDVIPYMRAAQALFEFIRSPCEARVKTRKEELVIMIQDKLKEIAELHKFPALSLEDHSLDDLVKNVEAKKGGKDYAKAEEELLVRALTIVLFGKDSNEKSLAEKSIETYLIKPYEDDKEVGEFFRNSMSLDLKILIYEHVAYQVKAQVIDKIGSLQFQLFLEGPVKAFLAGNWDRLDLQMRSILYALGNHPVTREQIREEMGQEHYDQFMLNM